MALRRPPTHAAATLSYRSIDSNRRGRNTVGGGFAIGDALTCCYRCFSSWSLIDGVCLFVNPSTAEVSLFSLREAERFYKYVSLVIYTGDRIVERQDPVRTSCVKNILLVLYTHTHTHTHTITHTHTNTH